MDQTVIIETMQHWKEDAKKFDGDRALFWAGKMSILVEYVSLCRVKNLSHNVELLVACKHEYDNEIFSRVK